MISEMFKDDAGERIDYLSKDNTQGREGDINLTHVFDHMEEERFNRKSRKNHIPRDYSNPVFREWLELFHLRDYPAETQGMVQEFKWNDETGSFDYVEGV